MSVAVRRALYGKLSGDTTLTSMLGTPSPRYSKAIYYQDAPDDIPEAAGFPYIIFQQMSGTPQYHFKQGGAPVDNEIWMVKGVDRSESADGADGIADRLNVLLTDGSITISGKTQLYLRRESDLPSYSEVTDGVRYIHSGAMFRLTYE